MLKDKKALLITLCMPIVLTTILGFAFQGLMQGSSPVGPADIGIVNLSSRERDMERLKTFLENPSMEGRLSGEQREIFLRLAEDLDFVEVFYREVLDNPDVKEFIRYEEMDITRAKKLLEKGELAAVAVLPEGFAYDILMSLILPFRNPVTVEIIKHPDQNIKGEIVSGIMKGFTDALSASIIAKNVILESAIEYSAGERAIDGIEGLINNIYDTGIRDIDINRTTTAGKRVISSFQYYAVGMAVMFILYTAANGGQYSIDEINNSTYRRLVTAGAGHFRILGARFTATAIFALLQFTALILYSILFFKTNWGNPMGVICISILLAASVGALSVFLSAINLRLRNNRASIVFQAAVIQVFALLGGSFFPVSGIPIMQRLGRLTINGAAMDGFLHLMMGYGLKEAAGTFVILFSLTLTLFFTGALITAGMGEM